VDLRSYWKLPETELYGDLLQRYAEPHRRYHTRQHLAECFQRLDEIRHLADRPADVELAIWFHDAVYDPRRDDNEQRSAALAGERLTDGARVAQLVLATRHAAKPADADARVLVDVDLWILAAPRGRFDEYEAQIHEEYSWMPWPAYRRGRAKLIAGFLARDAIFSTPPFVERYEARARANLARSLARL
jgi:predicted metal-dependent HD superfamily phosphohydrolase